MEFIDQHHESDTKWETKTIFIVWDMSPEGSELQRLRTVVEKNNLKQVFRDLVVSDKGDARDLMRIEYEGAGCRMGSLCRIKDRVLIVRAGI